MPSQRLALRLRNLASLLPDLAPTHASLRVKSAMRHQGTASRHLSPTITWKWNADTVDGIGYQVVGALSMQVHHLNSAGRGDSGGPVFMAVKGGVEAVGIVSATQSTKDKAVCTGVDPTRGCFWSLEFPLMTGTKTSIETLMKLTVNTA